MLQNLIKTFNNDREINAEVNRIENCKYCTVKDIRVLYCDSGAKTKAQILYNYDIDQYNKDLEEKDKKDEP